MWIVDCICQDCGETFEWHSEHGRGRVPYRCPKCLKTQRRKQKRASERRGKTMGEGGGGEADSSPKTQGVGIRRREVPDVPVEIKPNTPEANRSRVARGRGE